MAWLRHVESHNIKVQSMDDKCGEWVESMGVVSRRRVWVESIGVGSGCGCKKVYRFPHITYLLWLTGAASADQKTFEIIQ